MSWPRVNGSSYTTTRHEGRDLTRTYRRVNNVTSRESFNVCLCQIQTTSRTSCLCAPILSALMSCVTACLLRLTTAIIALFLLCVRCPSITQETEPMAEEAACQKEGRDRNSGVSYSVTQHCGAECVITTIRASLPYHWVHRELTMEHN